MLSWMMNCILTGVYGYQGSHGSGVDPGEWRFYTSCRAHFRVQWSGLTLGFKGQKWNREFVCGFWCQIKFTAVFRLAVAKIWGL